MTPPDDPLTAALALGDHLDERGIPYAVGGALAYGLWAVPRATVDVDINVFVEPNALEGVFDALQDLGIELDRDEARHRNEQQGMFVGRWGRFRIDVFTPSIPFSWEAQQTRVRVEVGGSFAWFLAASACAVFKLLFFRGKDLVDLERLVAVQGEQLDLDYVRDRVSAIVGDDDPRIAAWDRLVAEALAQGPGASDPA